MGSFGVFWEPGWSAVKIVVDKTLILAANPFQVATRTDGTVAIAIRAEGVAISVTLDPREATVYGTGLIQCGAIAKAIAEGRAFEAEAPAASQLVTSGGG